MERILKVSSIDINGLFNPIGIDSEKPIFHYMISDLLENEMVSAYKIVVKNGNKIAWETDKITSDGTPFISYSGEKLEPKTIYSVKIKLWNSKDIEGEFSDEFYFETGFLKEEWQAEWIEPNQEPANETKELKFFELFVPKEDFFTGDKDLKECKSLRKSFVCNKNIKKARLYASAHGVYDLLINGKKVSGHRLAPEVSAYQDILYYQTYDLTEFIYSGENVLATTLGDGWWIGRLGISGDSCQYGNKLGFICELEIEYEDGEKETICSNEDFKSNSSYIKYSDLYIGEKWDLRDEIENWSTPGFDDFEWENCKIADYKKDNLIGQCINNIQKINKISPKKIFLTPKNELVIDFGQVLAGICRIEIFGNKGEEVTFEHSEVLDENGNFKNNIIGRYKNQKDVLICKAGKQVFEPKFTYHGFRFLKVSGIGEDKIIDVKAIVLGTKLEKTGHFECSDTRLNQLQHNIEWSTISNMFSIPTDCPQREKLGWTGDIQVFSKTGCFNYDLKNFLECWLMNLRAEQEEDGEVPMVIPNFPYQERNQRGMGGSNSSAAWSDACVFVPYHLYQSYGDKNVLIDNVATMEKWLKYIEKSCQIKPDGFEEYDEARKERNKYLSNKGFHFGDWLIPSIRELPDGVMRGVKETAKVVASCYYSITVECFIKICEILNENEKTEKYKELLENINKAIVDEYVSENGTINDSNLQGLYVVVLATSAVKGDLKEKVSKKLVDLISGNGYRLDTGFASIPFLLDVLTDCGYKDVAYKLLFQTKAPSWLYMIDKGATSIWENWVAVTPEGIPTDSSYNHYAFGCVGDWIYRNIGGIKIKEAGYRRILFEPDFECGLEYSNSSTLTKFGRVSCNWKYTRKEKVVEIEIPVGCVGEIQLNDELKVIGSGKHKFIL